jgi:hypothetical protein
MQAGNEALFIYKILVASWKLAVSLSELVYACSVV